MPASPYTKQIGFTLAELAISLAIIALLVGGGMMSVAALLDRAQYSETRENLTQFKQTVLGFASRAQRLPRYTGTVAIDDELTNNIPLLNDFWGQRLVYLYDPELSRTDFPSPICAKRTTNITLRNCNDAACTTYVDTQNVAFAFFSTGKNVLNQTDAAAAGVVRTEPAPYLSYSGPMGGFGAANMKIIKTYPQGSQLGIYSAPTAATTSYDEMLTAITLDELRTRLGCSAKPLRLVNMDVPIGAQAATYAVDVVADGGVPVSSTESYRWCIESMDVGVDVDLAFQVKKRDGTDYSPARTISRQVTGACTTAVETSWGTGDVLRLTGKVSGSLAATGGARTRTMTIYVRDNQNNDPTLAVADTQDNIESRIYVVPINGP